MNKTVAVLVATMLCVLLTGSVAYGFNHADIDTLMETKQCANCDLSEANLVGLIVVDRDLDGSNLSGADLTGADLSGTDASGVNLSGAKLAGAKLNGTDLSGSNLSGADLTGASIDGTNFDGAKLDNTLWIDGQPCKEGSIETCNKEENK
jgi:uncharacterized protein YjbI with pentapeptide repeats